MTPTDQQILSSFSENLATGVLTFTAFIYFITYIFNTFLTKKIYKLKDEQLEALKYLYNRQVERSKAAISHIEFFEDTHEVTFFIVNDESYSMKININCIKDEIEFKKFINFINNIHHVHRAALLEDKLYKEHIKQKQKENQ